MAGWTDIPEEEGVSWIAVSSFGEKEAENHLKLLPGDAVIPSHQTEVG
jgi:hypothetical protein